ncbi:hypothetical protein FRB95_010897 [Tulasnella sp. JGI-2019a]|nr:hypothetical protein FRB95_010897 [Tulasnella sp. JGI-2019a]
MSWRVGKPCDAPIYKLPTELIEEVAFHSRTWTLLPPLTKDAKATEGTYDSENMVTADLGEDIVKLPSDLAALAATGRVFRSIVSPALLRDVLITSARRLRSLASLPPEKKALIHVLSLHMDSDFFAEFAYSLDSHFRTPQHINRSATSPHLVFGTPLIIEALCSIMVSTPHLKSFSIRLAKAESRSSAWSNFSMWSRGFSLKRAFEQCMRGILSERERAVHKEAVKNNSSKWSLSPARDVLSRFTWPELRHIHLDALEDIGQLLKLAPNLTHLSLRMMSGFDSLACRMFLADIKSALGDGVGNRLKSVALSARSLHLPGSSAVSTWGVELVEEFGKTCPELEELDLRVNAFSPDIYRHQTVYNNASFAPLVAALAHFQNLHTLYLPIALWDRDELDTFFIMGFGADESAHARRRRVALRLVAVRELDAMEAMAAVSPSLRQVSWVRKCHLDLRIEECSIQYEILRKRTCATMDDMATPSQEEDGSRRVFEIDHIEVKQTHFPPRVQELPRRICSPVSGPSFLGYARSSEGLSEFKSDHPWIALALLFVIAIVVSGMIWMRAHTLLHVASLAGVIRLAHAKTWHAPVAALVIIDSLAFLSPDG